MGLEAHFKQLLSIIQNKVRHPAEVNLPVLAERQKILRLPDDHLFAIRYLIAVC